MQITIAILAGGQSRRMGQDKASLIIDGEALLARTARLAKGVCPQVCVVGRAKPDGWRGPPAAFWPDIDAGQGPLGGLATALEHAEDRAVLLVACDLPRLTADALTWLMRQAEARETLGNGLVTLNDGQREPLFSVYAPTALPLVRRQLASGRRSLQALIEAGAFAFAPAPPDVQWVLRDVDTPEDLADVVQSPTRSP